MHARAVSFANDQGQGFEDEGVASLPKAGKATWGVFFIDTAEGESLLAEFFEEFGFFSVPVVAQVPDVAVVVVLFATFAEPLRQP